MKKDLDLHEVWVSAVRREPIDPETALVLLAYIDELHEEIDDLKRQIDELEDPGGVDRIIADAERMAAESVP